MERLTDKRMKGEGFIAVDPKEYKKALKNEKPNVKQIYKRLLEIEDILSDDYDLERLRELVEADREGRVRFVSKVSGDVCGTCKHFGRFSGRKMGACRVKKFAQDRRGREDRSREFVTSQSRRVCKKYEPREE